LYTACLRSVSWSVTGSGKGAWPVHSAAATNKKGTAAQSRGFQKVGMTYLACAFLLRPVTTVLQ
ncbi:MAG TPA: hypothetical protein VN578_12855, partial [Candidatus Binatia bacterium]|nr:hypothetical protein [Candidatus Binatia bacterium]